MKKSGAAAAIRDEVMARSPQGRSSIARPGKAMALRFLKSAIVALPADFTV
jgi:hypothetical protein